MQYAIPAVAVATLAIDGDQAVFPLRRIYCVGRNYAEHAREMGHDAEKEPPFFFMKPADSVVPSSEFPYPTKSRDVQHEIELVVAMGKDGKNIPADKALDHVFGYAVGLDMTRRDLQTEAKKMGRPWDTGKGFDFSAPCTPLKRASKIGHPSSGRIWLEVNGKLKQQGDLSELIWPVPNMIAFLSEYFELRAGDLIFTGTPAGVGPVQKGDVMTGGVAGVGEITTKVV